MSNGMRILFLNTLGNWADITPDTYTPAERLRAFTSLRKAGHQVKWSCG